MNNLNNFYRQQLLHTHDCWPNICAPSNKHSFMTYTAPNICEPHKTETTKSSTPLLHDDDKQLLDDFMDAVLPFDGFLRESDIQHVISNTTNENFNSARKTAIVEAGNAMHPDLVCLMHEQVKDYLRAPKGSEKACVNASKCKGHLLRVASDDVCPMILREMQLSPTNTNCCCILCELYTVERQVQILCFVKFKYSKLIL